MVHTVIARVNALGSDQPEQLTFTDRHGRLIVGDIEIPGVDSNEADDVQFPGEDSVIDDDIEIPGVDVEGAENPAPQIVEIDDLDIPEADPAPIEVALARTDPHPTPDRVGIPHVSQGEARREDQRENCGWRKQTARLHL